MSPRDYFYGAYMYYRLGQLSGDASRQSAYFTRAREMGLSSYERGHRSAELLTLLGNLHFRSGEYEVALDYYSSLGDGVNDPEVLFNKGWVHRSMGNYDRALELVEQALERLPSDAVDRRRQYRLARFRILIDQGNARDVIEPLRGMEGFDQDLRARTLYAEALVDLGFEQEARQALRKIVNQNNPPDRARRLLEQLRSDQSDVGS